MTGVKNQKGCSVCWAFSGAALYDSMYDSIKTGKLISLSEQNFVDCLTHDPNNQKCAWSTSYEAFQVAKYYGVMKESDYPYTAKGGDCKFNPYKSPYQIKDMSYKLNDNEEDMRRHVATVGPLGTAIISQPKSFQHYKGGLYTGSDCKNLETNHEVVIVGYGIDKKKQTEIFYFEKQ